VTEGIHVAPLTGIATETGCAVDMLAMVRARRRRGGPRARDRLFHQVGLREEIVHLRDLRLVLEEGELLVRSSSAKREACSAPRPSPAPCLRLASVASASRPPLDAAFTPASTVPPTCRALSVYSIASRMVRATAPPLGTKPAIVFRYVR